MKERKREKRACMRQMKKESEKEDYKKRIYALIRNGYYCIICNATYEVSIHIRITKYNAKFARGAL